MDKKILFKQLLESYPDATDAIKISTDKENGPPDLSSKTDDISAYIYERLDSTINIFLTILDIRPACSPFENTFFYRNFGDKNGNIDYDIILEKYKDIPNIKHLFVLGVDGKNILIIYNINNISKKITAKRMNKNTKLYLENKDNKIFDKIQIDYGKILGYPDPMSIRECTPNRFFVKYNILSKDIHDNIDDRISEKYKDLNLITFRINIANNYATEYSIELYNEIQNILLETLKIKTQFSIKNV